MSSITRLVREYCSSTRRLEYPSGKAGMLTFDAGEGMLLCANELGNGGVELFASPGYLSAEELASHPAGGAARGEEDADDAHCSIDIAPTGLVTLAIVRLEAPENLIGFKEAVETFRREYVTWEARLRTARDPETVAPPKDEEGLMRAIQLRV